MVHFSCCAFWVWLWYARPKRRNSCRKRQTRRDLSCLVDKDRIRRMDSEDEWQGILYFFLCIKFDGMLMDCKYIENWIYFSLYWYIQVLTIFVRKRFCYVTCLVIERLSVGIIEYWWIFKIIKFFFWFWCTQIIQKRVLFKELLIRYRYHKNYHR